MAGRRLKQRSPEVGDELVRGYPMLVPKQIRTMSRRIDPSHRVMQCVFGCAVMHHAAATGTSGQPFIATGCPERVLGFVLHGPAAPQARPTMMCPLREHLSAYPAACSALTAADGFGDPADPVKPDALTPETPVGRCRRAGSRGVT